MPRWPRYHDFFPRARHFVQFPGIPWSARGSKNRPFWYPDTKMARCHEHIVFTIQKLCFHAAKATKISIFWYPKTPTEQLSSRAGAKSSCKAAKQHSSKVPSQQLSSQAGAKMAKISRFLPARETFCPIPWDPLVCPGVQKSTVLVPRYQNGQISQ